VAKKPNFLPQPSRLVLNAGILTGAAIGFAIQYSIKADNYQSFLITAICAMVSAAIFSYTELFVRRYRHRHEK
jgi:hypothetical protein